MNIKTLTVTLETVTPLFLGGANQRGMPELRPPSFRGIIRYWLRATLGGVIGDDNLNGLHQLENVVFGSQKSHSPIHLRLSAHPKNKYLKYKKENILPHKGRGLREAFGAGQKIELTMQQFQDVDEITWNVACTSLSLALTFGGVGLRSRRGYGTLKALKSSDVKLVPLTPTSFDDWIRHIEIVVKNAINSAAHLAQSESIPLAELPNGLSRYPSATRKSLIRLTNLKTDSAMEAVSSFMKIVPDEQCFGSIKPRQGSPLWVRPVEIDHKYGLLFAVLASRFDGCNYGEIDGFLRYAFRGKDIAVKGWNL